MFGQNRMRCAAPGAAIRWQPSDVDGLAFGRDAGGRRKIPVRQKIEKLAQHARTVCLDNTDIEFGFIQAGGEHTGLIIGVVLFARPEKIDQIRNRERGGNPLSTLPRTLCPKRCRTVGAPHWTLDVPRFSDTAFWIHMLSRMCNT